MVSSCESSDCIFPLNWTLQCLTVTNSDQADADVDNFGDACDAFPADPLEQLDTDGDSLGDNSDAFPNDPTETTDSDGDDVGDNGDAFPNDATETLDTDGDGIGNDPVPDDDNDGVSDIEDAFPLDATRSGLDLIPYFPLGQDREWHFSGFSTPTYFDLDFTINGDSVHPLTWPNEGQEYFSVTSTRIGYHGFYSPSVITSVGDFTADVRSTRRSKSSQTTAGLALSSLNRVPVRP